jgi:hypothetical protein
VKVGDLVKWNGSTDLRASRPDTGIVVDGPREVNWKDEPAISYEVVWFDAKETFWHNDYNLELISESR